MYAVGVGGSLAHQGNIPRAKDALPSLRRFAGNANACFRSAEQVRAVESVLEQKKDLLVVQPTGSGKTLLFALPAMLFPDRIQVVVVPLVALMSLASSCGGASGNPGGIPYTTRHL